MSGLLVSLGVLESFSNGELEIKLVCERMKHNFLMVRVKNECSPLTISNSSLFSSSNEGKCSLLLWVIGSSPPLNFKGATDGSNRTIPQQKTTGTRRNQANHLRIFHSAKANWRQLWFWVLQQNLHHHQGAQIKRLQRRISLFQHLRRPKHQNSGHFYCSLQNQEVFFETSVNFFIWIKNQKLQKNPLNENAQSWKEGDCFPVLYNKMAKISNSMKKSSFWVGNSSSSDEESSIDLSFMTTWSTIKRTWSSVWKKISLQSSAN